MPIFVGSVATFVGKFLFTMHELNQGVREAEPPTLEKFKKTIPIYYSKIPIFVGSGIFY